jgi:hypothetical protein
MLLFYEESVSQELGIASNIQASNRGFGLLVNLRKEKPSGNYSLYELGYIGVKDAKEVRISNVNLVNPSMTPGAFTFGKVNYLQIIRVGLGEEFVLAKRPDKNAVGVVWTYSGGLNIGLQAPVYIDYNTPGANDFGFQTFRYDPAVHERQNIIQSRSALKGMGKSKILPGIYLKQGMIFEFGNYTYSPNRFETGFVLDAFLEKPVIIYDKKHPNIFLSFYVSFAILNFGL